MISRSLRSLARLSIFSLPTLALSLAGCAPETTESIDEPTEEAGQSVLEASARPNGSFSASYYHACAVTSTGTVKCWGWNQDGQLGDESYNDRTAPVDVHGLTRVVQVSVGLYHSCALRDNGEVWCWGDNFEGQLGTGNNTPRWKPYQAQTPPGVVAISAGEKHTCALLENGTARCWGQNDAGQLGTGDTSGVSKNTPQTLSGLADATSIDAGSNHTCATIKGGTVKCWGRNQEGEVGDNTTTNRYVPTATLDVTNAVAVSGGGNHTCALDSFGFVKCWGQNIHGEIGDGTVGDPVPGDHRKAKSVTGLTAAVGISAGSSHTCATRSDGTVRCWGDNFIGGLGDGTTTDSATPVTVSSLSGVIAVHASSWSSCARMADGTVRCWGWNGFGELGDNNFPTSSYVPSTAVAGVTGRSSGPRISSGWRHTCAVRPDSTVACWGWNNVGQLGDGSSVAESRTPVSVWNLQNATAVSAGGSSACALLASGEVRCWGDNSSGQLGPACATSSCKTPVTVTGLASATAISVGHDHACALLSNGQIACWGENGSGQLGDNTLTSRSAPQNTSGGGSFTSVSAGYSHTCASVAPGTAWCWGDNSSGQLGVVSPANPRIPTLVVGQLGVISVGAGMDHTCALKSDGTLSCWGDNSHGQLGIDYPNAHPTPIALTLTGATSISAGKDYTCANIGAGQARCWGKNGFGQLGDGSTAMKTSPTIVGGLDLLRGVDAGDEHTCAFKTDGTARCWGYNNHGQLGDGTLVNESAPTLVSYFP